MYLSSISAPVTFMVSITLSKETKCCPLPRQASRAALTALTAPMALRSIQGTCTRPPTGSHVRPKLCSIPISAALRHLAGSPPKISANAEAAMAQAEPTSPWQPTSAPEMEAFCLIKLPIAVAFNKNLRAPSWL